MQYLLQIKEPSFEITLKVFVETDSEKSDNKST
jgi:hypothetical protein